MSPTNFNPVPASPDTPPRIPPVIPGANEAATPPKSASAPITWSCSASVSPPLEPLTAWDLVISEALESSTFTFCLVLLI